MGEGGAHYGNLAGTSFSSPQVSGIAALIWAVRPELKNYQVADIIKQSAAAPGIGLDAGDGLRHPRCRRGARARNESPRGRVDGPAAVGDVVCSAGGDRPATWPTELNQTITFDPIGEKTLGDSDFPVTRNSVVRPPALVHGDGPCTVSNGIVHLTGAGVCEITASQAGDATYNLARDAAQSFVIEDVRCARCAPCRRPGGGAPR